MLCLYPDKANTYIHLCLVTLLYGRALGFYFSFFYDFIYFDNSKYRKVEISSLKVKISNRKVEIAGYESRNFEINSIFRLENSIFRVQ